MMNIADFLRETDIGLDDQRKNACLREGKRARGVKKLVHDGRMRPLQFRVYDAILNK